LTATSPIPVESDCGEYLEEAIGIDECVNNLVRWETSLREGNQGNQNQDERNNGPNIGEKCSPNGQIFSSNDRFTFSSPQKAR